jgi:hypothetical protein
VRKKQDIHICKLNNVWVGCPPHVTTGGNGMQIIIGLATFWHSHNTAVYLPFIICKSPGEVENSNIVFKMESS